MCLTASFCTKSVLKSCYAVCRNLPGIRPWRRSLKQTVNWSESISKYQKLLPYVFSPSAMIVSIPAALVDDVLLTLLFVVPECWTRRI